ncbi:Uncharacterised protein [Kluyvera cryocrescens]|uniref:Uncharacterized protein n=1 Tax=Kluyvera cryocrescens TaxID=580 RepID=A0A485CY72_KLUCR|nr:Uncharacterised protein [Kluyvera cryocrescens]
MGNVTNGGVTDDTKPMLSGTAELGSTIKIYDNGILVDSVVATGPRGGVELPSGQSATAGSAQLHRHGNPMRPATSACHRQPLVMTVNTTAPAAILNYIVTDDISPGVGVLTSGTSTNDSLPTISGIGGTPNTTVIVLDGGIEIGRATVNGVGDLVVYALQFAEGRASQLDSEGV